MRKRLKRLVALLVTLAMLLAMPGVALAAESTEAEQPPPEASETVNNTDASDAEETQEGSETVDTIDTSEAVGELTKVGNHLIDGAGLVYGEPPKTARRLKAAARASVCPTYQEAYEGLIALKAKYPEGMTWTNFTPYGRDGALGDAYWWRGGPVKGARGGVGCMGFGFLASDELFGDLPARTMDNGTFTYDDVKVGDILRMGSHAVIVLQKSAGGVTVAEGNYNKSVHWGRAISKAEVMASNFIVTRYPVNFVPSDAEDADGVAESGTEGSLGWTLTNGGTLTITGSGAMPNFTADNLPSWSTCNDAINSIVIEQGITSIGDFAFYQSKALAVYIPDGITSIGESVFYESDLLAVTVPSSVISIGNKAFYMCPNLTSVTMSEGLETIGEQAFRGCTALTHVDFPASVTSLGAGAFVSCSAMKQVRFKPGTEMVRIGDNLFLQCWHLSSITLPLKLDRIGKGMFESCTALTKIYIPANVSEIGESAFTQCAYLQDDGIYFGGSQQDWANIGGNAALVTLQPLKVNVYYDVDFDDPFAKDPDDPGDLVMGEPDVPPVDPVPDEHEHVWAEGWSNNNTHHWHECNSEGCPLTDETSKDGYGVHAYGDWVIDTNATTSQNGSKHRDCTICTYSQTESIPATGGSSGGNQGGGTIVPPVSPTIPPVPNTPKPSPTIAPTDPPVTGEPPLEPPVTGEPPLEPTTVIVDKETGTRTEITEMADGSSITRVIYKDLTITTTTVDTDGKTEVEVVLSDELIAGALGSKPVTLSINEVSLATDTTVTVSTGKNEAVKLLIPVTFASASTVVVIVDAEGTETIVKASVPTAGGMVVSLSNGATVKIIENSKDFADVADRSWFTEAVEFVAARELFAGTSKTTFSPELPMTRAMLMTVLARFDGAETAGGATWYDKSVEWAIENGISDGSSPNNNITREQMITMLWRYCGSPETDGILTNYKDMDKISSYAQAAMNWAVRNGIVSGFGDGRLGPKDKATRAQVAQILKNLIKNMTLS